MRFVVFARYVFPVLLLLFHLERSHAAMVDQLGRQVAIPSHPQRVVALAPSITEVIFALDRGARLVGVTRYSDYPPAAQSLPQVGSYIHLDLERIVALAPDLCIAVKDGNPKAVVDRLEAFGIPVYAVNPMGLESVVDTITEIAVLLNAQPEAGVLVADLRRRIQAVRDKVAARPQRPKVFFQIGIAPIVAVGAHTLIDELIVTAGGINATAGPVPYPRFSREQVIALAPDIIIITSMARGAAFESVKKEWEQWSDIPAVRHNRIYLVDSDIFDRASPRLVEALERLAGLIHPQRPGDNPP
jgi:iron complex transport system substrate-binding protein